MGIEFQFYEMRSTGDRLYNNVNMVSTIVWDTWKLLRGYILCDVHFATVAGVGEKNVYPRGSQMSVSEQSWGCSEQHGGEEGLDLTHFPGSGFRCG